MRYFRAAGWVIGNQAFVSASNFLGMVIAARVLSTADFATYVLAYTAMWVLNSIQASLITQPHSVLASHIDQTAYRRYTSAIALMQLALTSAIGIPIIAVGLGAIALGAPPILLALGFAVTAWQAQEFFRRILYFEGRRGAVVAVDIISYGGQLVATLLLASTGSFTVSSALFAAALTSASGAVLGLILLRSTLFHTPLRGAIRQNIRHGRWLLGLNSVSSSARAATRSCSRP